MLMRTRFYSILLAILAVLAAPSAASAQLSGEWEEVFRLTGTNSFHITKEGNFLLSDLNYSGGSGIYISTDQGKTWEKTAVAGYDYSRFLEVDGYIFASGSSGRIARSSDGGKTWEVLNYTRALEGILDPGVWDNTKCYAMEYFNGRLYIGDFSGGGVLYSEDYGETWKNTDVESLKFIISDDYANGKRVLKGEDEGGKSNVMVENIYNLASINGKLFAFGVYFVFRLNDDGYTWELVRDDSNFMAISTVYQGKLCCGRTVMNYDFATPFVEYTEDGDTWDVLPRPEGWGENNIRAMGADEQNLYVGMTSDGMLFTPDVGEHWFNISEGLPEVMRFPEGGALYCTPMSIVPTEDAVYVAMFDFSDKSGVFRLPKSALPTLTGISSLEQADAPVVADGLLQFGGRAENIRVYDLAGRRSNVSVSGSTADISTLGEGTYIYSAVKDGRRITGKFLKK